MAITVEVCIDNIESLATACCAGANRIELCSALALGGLTPTVGFVKQARAMTSLPLVVMIRPRAGDFVFDAQEIAIMIQDINAMKNLGIQGVVIGALTKDRTLDYDALSCLIAAAQGMSVTFHRAFDLCQAPLFVLQQLIDLGCHRLLTSGQELTAQQGIPLINQLVKSAKSDLVIMAGAGINGQNVQTIINKTGVTEVHLSGKTTRPSAMINPTKAKMGDSIIDDQQVSVTSFDRIHQVVQLVTSQ